MNGQGQFSIASINADVVVYSSFTPSSSSVCSGLGNANVQVTFGIGFKPNNGQSYRSGNPGYLFGSPVLVKENGGVDMNGFKLFSDD